MSGVQRETSLLFERVQYGIVLKRFAPALLGMLLLAGAACSASTIQPTPASRAALTHGPVVGAVTPHTARVLIRTSAAARVKLRYSTQPDLAGAQETAPVGTQTESDFTAQISLTDLMPATTYYLDVVVDDVSAKRAPYPSFQTFPPENAAADFSFVVLSDFKKDFMKPYPVETFARAAAEHPAFVIIGGDFDHRGPKTQEAKREMFKELYAPGGASGDLVAQILERFPVAHMWDDHDLGPNNADKTYAGKELALAVLKEYFPTYALSRHGDWQKFSYAQADFFLLDARSQRDPETVPNGPGKSMLDGDNLGAEGQLQWLLDGLKNSRATWKFILTPVVFNPTHPKTDAWYGFRAERDKIVKFIRDNGIRGVILISGDSHLGAIDDGTHSDFPEMIVPPANIGGCVTAPALGEWSEGIYAPKACPGYGLVRVRQNPTQVELLVQDDKGRTRVQYIVGE